MAYTSNFSASNTADFVLEISATDSETGLDVDFSDADASFVVKDENGCTKLTATIANGKITLPASNVLEVTFPDEEMKGLCPATYKVGAVYQINGETNQLFTGSMSVYDGIASL